jgi:hypothetical protein
VAVRAVTGRKNAPETSIARDSVGNL